MVKINNFVIICTTKGLLYKFNIKDIINKKLEFKKIKEPAKDDLEQKNKFIVNMFYIAEYKYLLFYYYIK
jgi:hypothetical protein